MRPGMGSGERCLDSESAAPTQGGRAQPVLRLRNTQSHPPSRGAFHAAKLGGHCADRQKISASAAEELEKGKPVARLNCAIKVRSTKCSVDVPLNSEDN